MGTLSQYACSSTFRLISVAFVLTSTLGWARTHYLSPTGVNTQDGTSLTKAWKTFPYAISKLRAGDTLILGSGEYLAGPAQLPVLIDCSAGKAVNGTASAPITVRAANERQAHLVGNGANDVIQIFNCSHWVIEGLSAQNADVSSGVRGNVIHVSGSNNILIRRNLVSRPNRYRNTNGIAVMYGSTHVTVEENEVYDFHRWGIICYPETVTNCIVRRNYVNPRGGSIALPGIKTGPLVGLGPYCAVDSIFENNIVEGVGPRDPGQTGGGAAFASTGRRNKFLGNISRDSQESAFGNAHHNNEIQYGERCVADNNTYINNVSILADTFGLASTTVVGTIVKNHSSFNSGVYGYNFNNAFDVRNSNALPHQHTPTFQILNSLAIGNRVGFQVGQPSQFGSRQISYSHGWANSGGTFGSGTTGLNPNGSEVTTQSPPTSLGNVDPKMGSCLAWIPAASPLKRAGASGADIGANVLYRYEGGALTSKPLWSSTGAFPCGAVRQGINNVAGKSCETVHVRLNINQNGCPFPAGYLGAPSVIPNSPTAFVVQ